MRLKPVIILTVSLIAAQRGMAQQHAGDTVLKGSTIEVIQSYKPQVRKAPKPEWVPQLPPADTTRPVLSYDVPQQTLYYSYSSGALRPLALGKDSLLIPFSNYIKAGAGNLSTLYLDAGIGSLKGKNWETGIHLHHLSQKGSIAMQQSAISGLEAEGALHKKDNDWHALVEVERNQLYYYGYDPSVFTTLPVLDLKQTFTTVRATADMQNKIADDMETLVYHPSVTGSVYDARFNTSENNFGVNIPFSYRLDSQLTLKFTASGSLVKLKLSDLNLKNNLAALTPGIGLNKGNLSGHALVGFAFGNGGKTFVLPDVVAEFHIPSTVLKLSGGWQSSVRQNTYEQLTTENPYLFYTFQPTTNSYQIIRQSRRDEIFASVSGSQGSHLTYSVRASWWNFTSLPTFVDSAGDGRYFNVVYDDVSALSLRAAVRYTQATKWSAGISADFYKYYQGTQPYVWGQPSVNIRGDVSVRPMKDLTVSGYVAILGGMYSINYLHRTVVLNPITDVGAYGEYTIVPRLSAFVQVSNILNSKYQRWANYQSYGLNVYAGVRLKF